MLGELLLEAREPRPRAVSLVLRAHGFVDEGLALLHDALQALLGDLDLAEHVCDLLVERRELVAHFGVVRAQLAVAVLGRLDGLDGVEARAAHVVEATGERALAVVLVAVERDGVEAVRAGVGTGNLERLADNGPAEDLLERRTELLGKLELVDPVHGGHGTGSVLLVRQHADTTEGKERTWGWPRSFWGTRRRERAGD